MPTIAEVAKAAGVSPTTTSFVLNGKADKMKISKASQQRVLEAAEALGYRSNYHAKALLHGKSMTLGFLAAVYSNRSRAYVANGVSRAARRQGYDILEVMPGEGPQLLDRGIQYLQENRIDGLVVWKENVADAAPALARVKEPLPIVQTWYYPRPPLPVVSLDPKPGIVEVIDHLDQLGHHSILWLGKRSDGEINLPERREAAAAQAEKRKLDLSEHYVELQGKSDGHLSAYYRVLRGSLPDLSGVSAVISYNDTMALALSLILHEHGVRIPEDISLIGFDDLQAVEGVPPLTTISHSFKEIGEKAVETVIVMAGDRELCRKMQNEQILVPSRLVVRESTGVAGKK